MRNFLGLMAIVLAMFLFVGCSVKNDQTQIKPQTPLEAKESKEIQKEPTKEIKAVPKEALRADYLDKIFIKKDISSNSQIIIFTSYKNQIRAVVYSDSLSDEGRQKCKFDEVVKFKNGNFYYEKNGSKIVFSLIKDDKILKLHTEGNGINFCKNSTLRGIYKEGKSSKNLITKYSFEKFKKDENLQNILAKYPKERIKKGVGYPDENKNQTIEYYILDSRLEPLFAILTDSSGKIINLSVISASYATPQGLSTASNLKDIFRKLEVSKIFSKDDKILAQVDSLGLTFELDGSNFTGKKHQNIDTLSINSPVSKIIIKWDN